MNKNRTFRRILKFIIIIIVAVIRLLEKVKEHHQDDDGEQQVPSVSSCFSVMFIYQ
jgi:hypothetical protein